MKHSKDSILRIMIVGVLSFFSFSSFALNLLSPQEEIWAGFQADQFCKELKSQPLTQFQASIDVLQKPGDSLADGQRFLETVTFNPLDQDSVAQLILQKGLTHSSYVLVNSKMAFARINACHISGLDPAALFYFRVYRNEVQARVFGVVGFGAVGYGLAKLFQKGWVMLESGANRFDLLRWVVVLSPWLGRQLIKVFFGYIAYEVGVQTCENFRSLTPSEKQQIQEVSQSAFSDTDKFLLESYQFLMQGKKKKLQVLQSMGLNPALQEKLQADILRYEEKIKEISSFQAEPMPEITRTGVSLYLQYFCDDLTAFRNKVRMSEK